MQRGEFDKDDEKFLVDFERKGWEEEKEEYDINNNIQKDKANNFSFNYGTTTIKEEKETSSNTQNHSNNYPPPAYTPVHAPPPGLAPNFTPPPAPTFTPPTAPIPTNSNANNTNTNIPADNSYYTYTDANGQQQYYYYDPASYYNNDPNAYNYYNYYNYDPNYYNYYANNASGNTNDTNVPSNNDGYNNNTPLFPPGAPNNFNPNNIPVNPMPPPTNNPATNNLPLYNNKVATESIPPPPKAMPPPPPPKTNAPPTPTNATSKSTKPQKYNFKDYSYNETKDPLEETRKLWEQEAKKDTDDYLTPDMEEDEKRRKRLQVLGGVVDDLAKGREKHQDTKQKRKQAIADRMKMIEERKKQQIKGK